MSTPSTPKEAGYFAAPYEGWDEGWFGPSDTAEGAIKDMQSHWIDDPLKSCVTCIGRYVTKATHPDLYDGDEKLTEWDYQVEPPYRYHDLSTPNEAAASDAPTPHDGATGEPHAGGCSRRPGDLAYAGTNPVPAVTFDSRNGTPDPSGATTSDADRVAALVKAGILDEDTSSLVAAETGTPEYFCQWCYDKGLRMPGGDGPWIHSNDCPNSPERASLDAEVVKLKSELEAFYRADSIRTEREFSLRDELKAAAAVILLARKALIANGNTREGSEALNRGSIAVSKFIAAHPELYGN